MLVMGTRKNRKVSRALSSSMNNQILWRDPRKWIASGEVSLPAIVLEHSSCQSSHDIIHLLTDLPGASSSRIPIRTSSPAPSPTSSWGSLPSDLEDTFQMSDPDEIAEYERTKRSSRIAGLREARLREREEEDRVLESKTQAAVKSWPEEEIVRSIIATWI